MSSFLPAAIVRSVGLAQGSVFPSLLAVVDAVNFTIFAYQCVYKTSIFSSLPEETTGRREAASLVGTVNALRTPG
jgi:hypothetical protein